VATIVVIQGESKGEKREIFARELTIGRHPSCELELTETTVSRRHARIVRRVEGFFIEDLGSQHGTWVNDRRVEKPTRLADLDIVKVSDVLLEFREVDYDAPTHEPSLDDDTSSSIIATLDVGSTKHMNLGNLQRKLKSLLDITRLLGSTLDLEKLFPAVLNSIFEIFPQAHRSYVLMADGESDKLVCRASKLRGEDGGELPISRAIARRVMQQRKAVLSADAISDERFGDSDSVASLHICSVMCVPLIGSGDEPIGLIHVDTLNRKASFASEDLEVLANVANLVARVLELLELHETQLQFDRREYDIQTARQVQLHFLPRDTPQLPDYNLCHYYQAAEGVGGDYFDYVPLPDGQLAIVMADISGKGVAAALLMARLCSEVRYALLTSPTPAEAVNRLNVKVADLVYNGRFATFALCVLDPRLHQFTLVNAGHMPPLHRSAADNTVKSISGDFGGPPLGVMVEHRYEQVVVPLAQGDSILLYTDGLNEALNPESQLFGCDRIRQHFSMTIDADTAIDSLLTELSAFTKAQPQSDDLCMLCFSRHTPMIDHSTILEGV